MTRLQIYLNDYLYAKCINHALNEDIDVKTWVKRLIVREIKTLGK